jgi:transmembrane sensor
MPDSIDWRIIDRHIAGETTAAEEDQLRHWVAADPRHAALLAGLRTAGHVSGEGEQWNVDVAWAKVINRIADGGPGQPLVLHSRDRAVAGRVRRRGLRAVGVTLATLAAALVIGLLWHPRGPGYLPLSVPVMREVSSAGGQQTRVMLHDGTRVVLNAGSRLRYAADFGRVARDVQLDGEGYFEVVHDQTRPFRVHARNGIAEDMGTRFVVRAYPELPQLTVVVAEGSVALRRDSAAGRGTVLAAGQLGRIESGGAVTVVNDVDVERWTSWTQGALVLDGMSLADAAAEIGRRFDVRVVIATPALAQRHVSARFRDEPLPAVLDAITVALGARWTRDGQTIHISRAD